MLAAEHSGGPCTARERLQRCVAGGNTGRVVVARGSGEDDAVESWVGGEGDGGRGEAMGELRAGLQAKREKRKGEIADRKEKERSRAHGRESAAEDRVCVAVLGRRREIMDLRSNIFAAQVPSAPHK